MKVTDFDKMGTPMTLSTPTALIDGQVYKIGLCGIVFVRRNGDWIRTDNVSAGDVMQAANNSKIEVEPERTLTPYRIKKLKAEAKIKKVLINADYDNLKHMTGCSSRYMKKEWGFRNHFAPGGKDVESMERLESAGYVVRGSRYHETNYFHATKEGCKAIGMSWFQIRNALS